MGVPVPRPVRGSSMHLIVAEDALQMALIDDPSFGVISGKFAGQIDPSNSGWQLGAFLGVRWQGCDGTLNNCRALLPNQ